MSLTDAQVDEFLGMFSASDLEEVMPSGNKTPEAAVLRLLAYSNLKLPVKASDLIQFIRDSRKNPEFRSGNSHKRGALMPAIAVVAHAIRFKGDRRLTAGMERMITTQFTRSWISDYIKGLKANGEQEMIWSKDGLAMRLLVPRFIGSDPSLSSWAAVAWPTR